MRFPGLLVLAVTVSLWTGTTAYAAPPPPPPPTPVCTICGGPPAPPARGTPVPPTQATPVPTVVPVAVAPRQVVAVQLTPNRVKRGGDTKLAVAAPGHSLVTVTVQYPRSRAQMYRLKLGDSGRMTKYWKVPQATRTGKAIMTVKVSGTEKYSATLTFTVV